MVYTILAFLAHFQKEMTERLIPNKPNLESMEDVPRRAYLGNLRRSVTTKERSSSSYVSSRLSSEVKINGSFDFRHGSIGNFLITGCRLFFKSLEYFLFV
jgi:hypothetical protein